MNIQTLFGMSDKTYNIIKWVTTIVLPAFGAAYFGLAQTWGLPNADAVVGTITIVVTLLGVLMGLSTRAYNALPNMVDDSEDGLLVVDRSNPSEGTYVALDSATLEGKDVIRLRVKDIKSQ